MLKKINPSGKINRQNSSMRTARLWLANLEGLSLDRKACSASTPYVIGVRLSKCALSSSTASMGKWTSGPKWPRLTRQPLHPKSSLELTLLVCKRKDFDWVDFAMKFRVHLSVIINHKSKPEMRDVQDFTLFENLYSFSALLLTSK